MIVDRYHGALLFSTRWDLFARDWRAAAAKERVVLEDGRPAIRREPADAEGEVTYTTLAPQLWERIKSRQREAFAMNPPPARTKLCEACRGQMKVAREYEGVWTFKCGHCGSSEIHSKSVVGGTYGAGETEKR